MLVDNLPHETTVSLYKNTADFAPIADYLTSVKSQVKLNFITILQQFSSPCHKLQNAIEYTVLSDGKCLRAALIYILGNNPNNALLDKAASAVELIHCYSLVHDDLPAMDNDDFRRGQPSCHIKFDEATAILVGDCLQSMAFSVLSDLDFQQSPASEDIIKSLKIIHILSGAIGSQGMVAGQSMELNPPALRSNQSQVLTQLDRIHHLKTGRLITASMQMAAIISDFDSEQYHIVTQLGYKLGLAFQIQDDMLDTYQNSETLGKPAQSDAKRDLPTYGCLVSQSEGQQILGNLWQDCKQLVKDLQTTGYETSPLLLQLIDHIADRQY